MKGFFFSLSTGPVCYIIKLIEDDFSMQEFPTKSLILYSKDGDY